MQDIDKFLHELENEPDKKNNMHKLSELIDQINGIFIRISLSKGPEEANQYFDWLLRIHSFVCKTIFLDKINVPDSLWKFFKDFDRIDTVYLRTYYFEKLKNGNYSL